jgi:hypothetical protein
MGLASLGLYTIDKSAFPVILYINRSSSNHSPIGPDFGAGSLRAAPFPAAGRDGFVSLEATGELQRPASCALANDTCLVSGPGVLLTRPLVFDVGLVHLFVNVDIRHGGFMQVELLRNNRTAYAAAASAVGPLAAGTAVSSPAGYSSTRAHVSWPAVADDLSAVAGETIQLRFYLSSASVYSFWFADNTTDSSGTQLCGASRGWLAGGGPGASGGKDARGGCV